MHFSHPFVGGAYLIRINDGRDVLYGIFFFFDFPFDFFLLDSAIVLCTFFSLFVLGQCVTILNVTIGDLLLVERATTTPHYKTTT